MIWYFINGSVLHPPIEPATQSSRWDYGLMNLKQPNKA